MLINEAELKELGRKQAALAMAAIIEKVNIQIGVKQNAIWGYKRQKRRNTTEAANR